MKATDEFIKSNQSLDEITKHCAQIGQILNLEPELHRLFIGHISQEISTELPELTRACADNLAKRLMDFAFEVTIIYKNPGGETHNIPKDLLNG